MSADTLDDVADVHVATVDLATEHRVAFRPASEIRVVEQHAELDVADWWRWSG